MKQAASHLALHRATLYRRMRRTESGFPAIGEGTRPAKRRPYQLSASWRPSSWSRAPNPSVDLRDRALLVDQI
ncbi:MAG: hypothetical protein ACREQ4_14680 [Candidatus Binataceae bacterium]